MTPQQTEVEPRSLTMPRPFLQLLLRATLAVPACAPSPNAPLPHRHSHLAGSIFGDERGRLFLGYFLLARQKKVTCRRYTIPHVLQHVADRSTPQGGIEKNPLGQPPANGQQPRVDPKITKHVIGSDSVCLNFDVGATLC